MTILDYLRNGVRIFDLAQPLENGMPCSPSHPGFHMGLIRRHGDRVNPDGGSGSNELITIGGHVGTHIDALAHYSMGGRLHGGLDAAATSTGGRFQQLGVETIEPIVCRGVLLDVADALGVQRLEPGYGISPEDLSKALGELTLDPGDVALIRTGWPQLYTDTESYLGQQIGAPGITESAAIWLARHGVRAAGIDTIAFDQIRPGFGHTVMPAHRVLLFDAGINIIEVLDLEEIAAQKVTEFMFVLAPLKLVGATGSPVRPLAVVEA
ncbi:cyclase family protein [Nocardia colli]|uniref:Cyclase family protein n=1 Tax=Nocardia colli TaxID=2545717 RepID=A0A5N0DU67_9NOCA|nr:cyclase family protein [Nocardia colli]KAA8880632.1 cyclase family protein [Nocardia colli]